MSMAQPLSKTHGKARGGDVCGKIHGKSHGTTHGKVHGKASTWHPVAIWYFNPSQGPYHLAPYSHPQEAEIQTSNPQESPEAHLPPCSQWVLSRRLPCGLCRGSCRHPCRGHGRGACRGACVGIAVVCRKHCRGVPWELRFTVKLAETCRGHCHGLPRHAMDTLAALP